MPPNYPRIDRLTNIRSRDTGGLSVPFDRPVIMESGEISRVDPVLFLVDVTTTFTGRLCRNLSVPGTGVSKYGAMMGYMPKVGDKCTIAHTSDEVFPKIMNFEAHISPRNGFRGNRRSMDPGDMMMSAESGNYVHVRAGGVVEIAANPVTRRIYVPLLNQIKDFCESHFLSTAGGVFRWESTREATDEGRPVKAVWDFKEFSDQTGVVATLSYGNTGIESDLPDPVIKSDEVKLNNEVVYNVYVDRKGNVLVGQNSIEFTISKFVRGFIFENLDLVVDGEVTTTFAKNWNATVNGSANLDSSDINLGKGGFEKALLAETFLNDPAGFNKFLTDLTTWVTQVNTAVLAALAQLNGVGPVPGASLAHTSAISAVTQAFATLSGELTQFQGLLPRTLASDTKLS